MREETINVTLSTSNYSVNNFFENLTEVCTEVCVCVAEQYLEISGCQKEMLEHIFSQQILKLAKNVTIDATNNSIFIGDIKKNIAILLYQENQPLQKYSKSFFECWEKNKVMLFEYQVISLKECIFAIRGLWINDKWQKLEVLPFSKITVIESD